MRDSKQMKHVKSCQKETYWKWNANWGSLCFKAGKKRLLKDSSV